MISKNVPEAGFEPIRKTDEHGVYEAVEREQRKTKGETRCATCQCPQIYTQEIWTDGSIYQNLSLQTQRGFSRVKRYSCAHPTKY